VIRSPASGLAVAEPFRSDPRFWRSLRALLLTLAVLPLGAAAAMVLAVRVGGLAPLVPLVVAALVHGRAGVLGVQSSRRSRAAFAPGPLGQRAWRNAERQAVMRGFWPALRGAGAR